MRIRPQVKLSCIHCSASIYRAEHHVKNEQRKNPNKLQFCGNVCKDLYKGNLFVIHCKQCGCEFYKRGAQFKRTKSHFCSSSCAAIYNNAHKTKGTRRSKLEIWLEFKLASDFPDLNIIYGDKTAIQSELDVYFPDLQLAFELNGLFHYEPIFGKDKLDQIQNNDNRKFQACLERGIELCIIDTSGQNVFKELTSQKYYDVIKTIVESKLVR